MNAKNLIAFTLKTLIGCFATYVVFAGAACFTNWTNEYWSLASWGEAERAFTFSIWLVLAFVFSIYEVME